jgi:hypothetical protein
MNATSWLERASPHLRARALWAALFALAGVVRVAVGSSPPPATPEGVAAMLGAAVDGDVRADDFVWEAHGSSWREALLGRDVLFLARRRGGPADLYRAEVELTRSGRPLRLRAVRNLTESPLGDERDLVALGTHAAYATTAFGAVQGVTVLDLDGERDAREAHGFTERLAASLDSWTRTGSAAGLRRTEITFGSPPREVRHELQASLLVLALGRDGLPAALDLGDGALNTGATNAYEASAQRIAHHTPRLGDALAAAAGELCGPRAGAALRGVVGVLDGIARRLRPAKRPDAQIAPPVAAGEPVSADASDPAWPPPPIAPPIVPAAPGEGVWRAGRARRTAGAPMPIIETSLRPDPHRPEAWVTLSAIDTRQIDLRLVPGVDGPRSEVGLHGAGRLRDPAIAERAAFAFASGPAAPEVDVEPGFIADHHVIVPAMPGLATLALTFDGRAELGRWSSEGHPRSGYASMRQTPDAILGWMGPARFASTGASDVVERSALGLTRGGQLVYAWSAAASADTLALALGLAGCELAVPLARAPAPVGLVYLGPAADSATRGMSLRPLGAEERSTNDMLVGVERVDEPPPLASGEKWAPDGGKQPTPAWAAAIHAATVVSLGAQVHLTAFAPGRVAFRMRAGAKEPATKAVLALPTSVAEGDRDRVLAAIGLAAGRRRAARGLTIEGAAALPFHTGGDQSGALLVDAGRVKVVRASDVGKITGDATELPLTADEGKLRPEGRDVGTMRMRAVGCALEDGTFVVASTTFDSDEAATTALLELGCSRVVALDRGSHHAAFLHRAGTAAPPDARYEATVLFVLDVPMLGRASPLER